MKAYQMKYNEEFRKDYPETVGETDHDFDTHNYVEWLEEYTSKIISDHKAVVETMQNLLLELSCDCNKVTAMNRHGIIPSQESINKLYTTQLKVEKYLKGTK